MQVPYLTHTHRLWDRRQGSRQTETPPPSAGAEASAPGMEEVKESRLVVSTIRQAKQLLHQGLDSGSCSLQPLY